MVWGVCVHTCVSGSPFQSPACPIRLCAPPPTSPTKRATRLCALTVLVHAVATPPLRCLCLPVFDAALPFGGYKQSGWGREMGPEAVDLYTEIKSVVVGL